MKLSTIMDWFRWFILTAICFNFTNSLENSADIYEKLIHVVRNKSADADIKFLDKYYFTENKNDSIWSYTMNEAQKLLHQTYARDELITWEKEIRDLKILFKDCSNEKQTRPDCNNIFDKVHRYTKDFSWPALRGEFFRRFKAPIRTAFQSMIMLMFSAMAKRPWIKTYKEAKDWYNAISHEYSEVGKFYADFSKKIHQERSWDFSVPEVCEVRRFMWKDFEQPSCEKRWRETDVPDGAKKSKKSKEKRSTDKQDKWRKTGVPGELGIQKKNESDDDDDDDDDDGDKSSDDSDDDPFFKTFAGNNQDREIKIGGFSSEFEFIMKARFTDETAKKEIIVDRRSINVRQTTKGEVIEEMISEAYAKRNELVKSKVAEMDKYVEDTYGAMRKAEVLFVKNIKKQIRKWESKNHVFIPE